MKNILKNLLLLFLLVVFLQLGVVKSVKADSPFDSYDNNISWIQERIRLDNLAIHLRRNPEDIGYIIFYTDKKTLLKKIRTRSQKIKRYLVNHRGIESNRVVIVYAKEHGLSLTVLSPRDKNKPVPEH